MTRLTSGLAMLLVLTLAACKSNAPAPSSSSAPPGSSGPLMPTASSSALPTTFTTVTIADPSFNNMPAETMTIPAGWKMDGTIMTAPCTTLPWPVYRAHSADSLTEIRQEPALGWHWSTSNAYTPQGCLAMKQLMSASDFLQHFLVTLPGGVNVVGPAPVAPAFIQWAQHFADMQNQNSAKTTYAPAMTQTTADTAAMHIQTHNGTFLIDQRLRAVVVCTIYPNPGPLQGGSCWARVDDLRAPQGQLDALSTLVDNNNLPNPQDNPQWDQAVLARARQQNQQALAAMNKMQQQAAATFRAMFNQFMQTMQQNFQNFQASQQAKFNDFQANMAAQNQASANAASDWVDFALDQQTVTGPGGTVKVSNQYSQTWSDGTQWYQTNDPGTDPNGVIPGNWTLQTPTHGNGAPM
jgi:hypothetical protein